MKKLNILILIGLLSTSILAENGKWFDYGDGIINLNNVNKIISESKCDSSNNCGGFIKFDNFSLTVFTSFSKDKKREDKYKDAQDKVKDVMGEIRDFLDDDNTYLKL